MKQRLTAILLVLFSKSYIVITEEGTQIKAEPSLKYYGMAYLEEEYKTDNAQESAVQQVYDILNCGK